jgi:hypothetical protein
MTQPPYPAARAAAVRVHPHYAPHLQRQTTLLPDVETIEAIVNVAFWASLRREESYTPRISLAFVCPEHLPEQAAPALFFEHPVPVEPQSLTRLGPAVERPGIHLCVSRRNGDLIVWGATRVLPEFCFVLEVVAPGLLVVKRSRGDDSAKYVNVAVLQGDELKVINQQAADAGDCPKLLPSLLGLHIPSELPYDENVLISLAVSMRAHGRGGLLLVVPAGTQSWRESILHPVTYAIAPAFSGLADLMRDDSGNRTRRRWQEALHRIVDAIAGLTAVDGATIITEGYELLAFGAKIVRRVGCDQVGSVRVTEPIEGTVAAIVEPGQLGGTRHLSSAQFVQDQRDAIALVASQDGRFTVFAWSECERRVQANRIEALLL